MAALKERTGCGTDRIDSAACQELLMLGIIRWHVVVVIIIVRLIAIWVVCTKLSTQQ